MSKLQSGASARWTYLLLVLIIPLGLTECWVMLEETWECGWVFVAKRYVSGCVTNLSEWRVDRVMAQWLLCGRILTFRSGMLRSPLCWPGSSPLTLPNTPLLCRHVCGTWDQGQAALRRAHCRMDQVWRKVTGASQRRNKGQEVLSPPLG